MKKSYLLATIAFLGLMSCNSDEKDQATNIFEFNEVRFKQEKEAWEKANYQNYSFTFSSRSSSYGLIENNITVVNGVATGDNEDMKTFTISELYENCESIANSYLSGTKKNEGSYHISYYFKYNKEYHFPEEISFTQYNMPPGGGGSSHELTNFEITE